MKLFVVTLFLFVSLWAQERIVSLSPSITEILFGLGLDQEIVATTTHSTYPKAAQNLPVIGSYVSINIEKVYSLKPTVVIAQTFQKKSVQELQKVGIKTQIVALHTLDDIKQSIQTLGKRFHKEKEALRMIEQIKHATLSKKKSSKTKKRVLIVFGLPQSLQSRFYIAGKGIFFDDIISICGAKNAYNSKIPAQPVLDYEHLISLNPDVLFFLYNKQTQPHISPTQVLEQFESLPLEAAKKKQIYLLEGDYLLIPSQRVAQTIQRICQKL